MAEDYRDWEAHLTGPVGGYAAICGYCNGALHIVADCADGRHIWRCDNCNVEVTG